MFLQETHSTVNGEIKWKEDFKGEVFYSHGKSNSCGVLICFIGSKKIFIRNKLSDNDGCMLILDVDIDDENFILINLYNPNTEAEQLKTLSKLTEMLIKLHLTQNNNIICAGDFNLFFNVKLESYGGNPVFKKRSVGKIVELKETYNLTDIWRVRNPKAKQYTFRQKHVSGFLQRRLDYFFISNTIQEFILDTDIIPAISSDHSPILISFSKEKQHSKSSGFWKFNNSLLSDNIFKEKLKQHIQNIESDNELSNDPQIKWEFLKYQIRKFTIRFSKTRAKEERKQRDELETTLKSVEKNLSNGQNQCLYDKCKRDLEEIYDNIAERTRVRSRCQWYEEGEKSSKFFLNLEKFNGTRSQIRKIIVNDQEIVDPNKILNEIRIFYESLFRKGDSKPPSQINDFLDKVQLPKSNITESNECDNELSEKELYISLMSMQKNKSPGNDGLTKEFFVAFWEDIKGVFFLIHVVQQNLKRN